MAALEAKHIHLQDLQELQPTDSVRENMDNMWTYRHEEMLKDWAEQALCYQKMHEESHHKYARQNIQLTLPVIVMSTITGTANFALTSFSHYWQKRVPVIIGSLNILAGMITTIAQYLRVSEKSEGHRVAALAYGKLSRGIASELKLPRRERSSSGLQYVRVCCAEMDRLEEQSPDISGEVVQRFEALYDTVGLSCPSIVVIKPISIFNDECPRRPSALKQLMSSTSEEKSDHDTDPIDDPV